MITSSHNPRLQRIRALLDKRKQRDTEQAFVVEGVRLAEEALSSRWQAELVLFSSQLTERGLAVARAFEQSGAEVVEIAPHIFDSLAGTETPQGILAVVTRRAWKLPEPLNFVLVADHLRDPGNLGTLLRSAAAAGVQAVLLSPGTADAFAPKVLRAGMGAHFRLPIFPVKWEELQSISRQHSLRVLLAEAEGGVSCWEFDLRQPVAMVVGNEAEGASPEARALADTLITIPMPGRSESLNAAVAASILLFEVVRQRQGTP